MADVNGMVVYERGQDIADADVWDDTALIKAYECAVNNTKGNMCMDSESMQIEAKDESELSIPSMPQKKKNNRRQKKKQNKSQEWCIGDECQAIYTEDGLIYNACIISTNYSEGTCYVHYTDYGNEEQQNFSDLLPAAAKASYSDAKMDSSECGSAYTSPSQAHQHQRQHSSKHSKSSRRQRRFNPSNQHWMPPFTGGPPNFFNGMPPFPWNNMPPSSPAMGLPLIPPPPPPTNNEAMNSNEALCSMLMSWYMSGYHTGYYQGLSHSQKNK